MTLEQLPFELERQIFELAFFESGSIDLLLVARRIHTWLQPLLFERVLISRDNISSFTEAISSKPPDVRNKINRLFAFILPPTSFAIFQPPADSPDSDFHPFTSYVTMCPNIQEYSCWLISYNAEHSQASLDLLQAVARLPLLRVLSMAANQILAFLQVTNSSNLSCPNLKQLSTVPQSAKIADILRSAPNLTHLAVYNCDEEDFIVELHTIDSLKVIVLLGPELHHKRSASLFPPTDFPKAVRVSLNRWKPELLTQARRDTDFWDKAEEKLAEQRRALSLQTTSSDSS